MKTRYLVLAGAAAFALVRPAPAQVAPGPASNNPQTFVPPSAQQAASSQDAPAMQTPVLPAPASPGSAANPSTTALPGLLAVQPFNGPGDAAAAEVGIRALLQVTPGGMTADRAASRAREHSPNVRAALAAVEAASAAQMAAMLQMIPTLQLSARYTRLSPYDVPNLTSGFSGLTSAFSALSTNLPGILNTIRAGAFTDVFSYCAMHDGCGLSGLSGLGNTNNTNLFPVVLDQLAVRASLTIPVTDIPLRLLQVYRAAGLTEEARRIDLESSRAQAAEQGRISFYNFVQAKVAVAAVERGLVAARSRRDGVEVAVRAGAVPRAAFLAADAGLAQLEQALVAARAGAELTEAILRQRIGASPDEVIAVGEPLDTADAVPTTVTELVSRAQRDRPEARSMDRQMQALGLQTFATRAGMFPSLVAVGNADGAQPNSRWIGTTDFRGTWDITLQLMWSPNQTGIAYAQGRQLDAQRAQMAAGLEQLREGIELEVRSLWTTARTSAVELQRARTALANAEENARVARERLNAGTAVSTDALSAEAELLNARVAVIRAATQVRTALASLRRATGQEDAAAR